jgi:hypothetical protein
MQATCRTFTLIDPDAGGLMVAQRDGQLDGTAADEVT